MNRSRKQNWAALLGGAVMSLALLSGTVALADEPAVPAAQRLTAPKPSPKAGLLLPAVQAAREAAARGKDRSKAKKPPKDIAWPVPICKPGPGCPP